MEHKIHPKKYSILLIAEVENNNDQLQMGYEFGTDSSGCAVTLINVKFTLLWFGLTAPIVLPDNKLS